jgi:hypothetical protein
MVGRVPHGVEQDFSPAVRLLHRGRDMSIECHPCYEAKQKGQLRSKNGATTVWCRTVGAPGNEPLDLKPSGIVPVTL